MITSSSNDLTLILYVIGRSERPLTSQEIRNQIDISNSKKSGWYGHEILKELVPTGKIMRGEPIFVLEEILSKDIDKKLKSIKKLEDALKLNWNITKEDIETESLKIKAEINTEKVEQSLDLFLELYYGKTRKITITNKDREDKELALVIISKGNHKEVKNLFIEENQQKKLTVYSIKENYNPIDYLDITYDNETRKTISSLENDIILGSSNSGEVIKGISQEDWNIEKERESTINIENLKSDRPKWRFSLNLRGFLMYLNRENRSNIERIKEVLSNPTIKDKFIFLNSWEKFEEKRFQVMQVTLEIANEFKNQLEYDEQYLLIRVTERYLFEINKHFSKYDSFFIPISLSQETENMLNQYRLMILEFLKKRLILYTNGISKQIQYIKSGREDC